MKKSLALFLTLLFVFTAVFTFAFTTNVMAGGPGDCCYIEATPACTDGRGELDQEQCVRSLTCGRYPVCF